MKGNQLMRKPKLLRALLILLFVAAPIQWTRAQIVLSTPKTTLGAVIKNIKSQSNYQFLGQRNNLRNFIFKHII